jgi:two-component system chemotaxis response regulator CheB
MDKEPIRVLLVDDSILVIVLLTRILSAPGTGIKVIGNARDGKEALRKIPELDPQVICTDLQMPGMNGLELTRNVMAQFPRPILVLSSAVEKGKNDDNIYKLLGAGAIDILPKPQGSSDGNLTEVGKDLIAKIKLLAGVVTFTRKHVPEEKVHHHSVIAHTVTQQHTLIHRPNITIPKTTQIITIGSSTGGPQALQKILSNLSPKLLIPVVCIQHVTEGFTEDLVDWLGASCPLTVRVTKIGETLSPGVVYFPPDTKHLILDEQGRCTTKIMGCVAINHRPSITFAFNSIAQYYRSSAVGILLTGMGSDGADGLLNIRKAGGITIAQDEASCVVYGMPKVAAEIGAVQHVLSLTQIVNLLKEL